MNITFALSPFSFSLSSFLSPGARLSSHVHTTNMDFNLCGHLHPWVPPSSFTWIGLSYLITHLDAKISPTRFHQLSKTKLRLSVAYPCWSPELSYMQSCNHCSNSKAPTTYAADKYTQVGKGNVHQLFLLMFVSKWICLDHANPCFRHLCHKLWFGFSHIGLCGTFITFLN